MSNIEAHVNKTDLDDATLTRSKYTLLSIFSKITSPSRSPVCFHLDTLFEKDTYFSTFFARFKNLFKNASNSMMNYYF